MTGHFYYVIKWSAARSFTLTAGVYAIRHTDCRPAEISAVELNKSQNGAIPKTYIPLVYCDHEGILQLFSIVVAECYNQ